MFFFFLSWNSFLFFSFFFLLNFNFYLYFFKIKRKKRKRKRKKEKERKKERIKNKEKRKRIKYLLKNFPLGGFKKSNSKTGKGFERVLINFLVSETDAWMFNGEQLPSQVNFSFLGDKMSGKRWNFINSSDSITWP